MKMFKRSQTVLVLVLSVMFFYACSKDSNNPVNPPAAGSEAKLTLNGAGYTNQQVTLSNGLSAYSPTDTMTVIQFSGKAGNDSLYFFIVFKGNQAGTFNWNTENGAIIVKNSSSTSLFYLGVTQGTTIVSSYGAVNGKVEGTISGKLIEETSQVELNITSGSFSAVRVPDI